ncbi:S-layer homology domain-containing protein [Paenibacillus chibensis]|uniref:S-layer homology domain-containing protein n=1 Tax=Paenibacillus chibensis TaxID=59846 RepID=UPI000FDBD625|nr:S-layer homology domain-containing protein [Paenibacillus chibensis]MEC0371291.1 S-layer homology domain-containing protein [Paenibacillus chibensis]
MKKPSKIITLSAAVALAFSLAGQDFASAAAFKDLDNVQDKDKIIALHDSGLIKGITAEQFAPNKTVTQAESVQFFVTALGLNLDFIRFVKEPQATDYYKHSNDSAWYAKALIIAAVNGLDLPADLNPNEKMTHEAFTHQLVHAIEIAGKLPLINPIVQEFKDQDQVKVEYSGSIQRALNYGVVSLDQDGKFQPKKEISRAEAAIEMSNALHYLKTHSGQPGSENLAITAEQAVELIKKAAGNTKLQIKIDAEADVTRESFTYLLIHTLQAEGKLPMLNIVLKEIKDNDQIDIQYQGAIQTALALKIAELDAEGNFHPKNGVTLADATAMIERVQKLHK